MQNGFLSIGTMMAWAICKWTNSGMPMEPIMRAIIPITPCDGQELTKTALLIGGPMGIVIQTPIEVFDGLYEGWGFSWWDMAANTFGAALFTAQEAIFDEQPVVMKFSYSPSEYPRYHPILGENNFMSFFSGLQCPYVLVFREYQQNKWNTGFARLAKSGCWIQRKRHDPRI